MDNTYKVLVTFTAEVPLSVEAEDDLEALCLVAPQQVLGVIKPSHITTLTSTLVERPDEKETA